MFDKSLVGHHITPRHQTLFGNAYASKEECGNCYQAVLATLLNLPLAEVPHFVQEHFDSDNGEWFDASALWMNSMGVGVLNYWVTTGKDTDKDILEWVRQEHPSIRYCWVGGQSVTYPDGQSGHSIVYDLLEDKMAHDPNPSGKGVSEIWHFSILSAL